MSRRRRITRSDIPSIERMFKASNLLSQYQAMLAAAKDPCEGIRVDGFGHPDECRTCRVRYSIRSMREWDSRYHRGRYSAHAHIQRRKELVQQLWGSRYDQSTGGDLLSPFTKCSEVETVECRRCGLVVKGYEVELLDAK